jgi:hypothetical protein
MKLLIMQFSPTSRLGLIEIKSLNLLGGTAEKTIDLRIADILAEIRKEPEYKSIMI